jgi:FG-GAP-like repeat
VTTTPRIWKSQTQVNTSDAPVAPGGTNGQFDPQIVQLQDGGYVVVWTDTSRTYNANGTAVVGQRYNSAGNKVGGEVYLSPSISDEQFSPAVTVLPNGNIAVAFVDRSPGVSALDDNIVVRIFDSALNYIKTDVIDAVANQTVEPSITVFGNGNYVVSYTLFNTASDSDIVARVVNSATGVVGRQFDIENQTDNRHVSQLATLSNGNFVAVYQDEVAGSTTNTDILYRIFTPAGAPVTFAGAVVPGGAFTGLETDPDVAALGDGNFVVVWTDPDSTVTDIRATILSSTTGGAVGLVADNLLVNTSTTNAQSHASVMALPDGGFLVSWYDGNTQHARAQRFDAVGNKIGVEVTVESAAGQLSSPEAALLADGRIAYALLDVSTGDFDVATSIWTMAAPNDFNVNGLSDILWQSSAGTPAVWLMNGTSSTFTGAVGPSSPGPSWQVKDSGDFNADGDADILWQGSDGTPAVWFMDRTNVVSSGAVGPFNPGPSWQIRDSGDFNADGRSDILWQNSDGTPAIWLMDGVTALATGAVGPFNPGPGWQIKATGDFNGDRKSDILWQSSDGTPAIWLMDGMSFISSGAAGPFNPGPSWEIKGTGDFNGDGLSDILWQNSDGTPAIWLMNSMTALAFGAVGPFNPGPSWHVEGTGDYNGDNKSDILWQSSDGTPAIWFMDGMTFLSSGAAGSFNPGPDWHVIA